MLLIDDLNLSQCYFSKQFFNNHFITNIKCKSVGQYNYFCYTCPQYNIVNAGVVIFPFQNLGYDTEMN